MPYDPELVAETRAWLAKAAEDLATAAYELQANPPFTADIAFHAQQTVEKGLKAFLTWHGRPFRKTHNLTELGESCTRLDSTWQPLLRASSGLTEYAWRFRYPGEPAAPGRTIGQGVGSGDHASAQGSHSTRPSRSRDLCRQ